VIQLTTVMKDEEVAMTGIIMMTEECQGKKDQFLRVKDLYSLRPIQQYYPIINRR